MTGRSRAWRRREKAARRYVKYLLALPGNPGAILIPPSCWRFHVAEMRRRANPGEGRTDG